MEHGKRTLTEQIGRRRRAAGRPVSPGKITMTSYLGPQPADSMERTADAEYAWLREQAWAFESVGLPLPTPLTDALAQYENERAEEESTLDVESGTEISAEETAAAAAADLDEAAWSTHERRLAELAHVLGLSEEAPDIRIDDDAKARNQAQHSAGLLADGIVYLHPDRYRPGTAEGTYLLAHELVHLGQRRLGEAQTARAHPSAAEREAHDLASAFAEGRPVHAPAVALAPHAVAADTGDQAGDGGGQLVGSYARVTRVNPFLILRSERDPRRIEPGAARTDPLVVDLLSFNDRVQVLAAYPGNWVHVATDRGTRGYIDRTYIIANPPEPNAWLYRTLPGDTALGIAMRHYHGVDWGKDNRFYVNVLVHTNRMRNGGDVGLYTADGSSSWQDAEVKEGYWIWIPSRAFADSLHGALSSGSISYQAKQAGESLLAFMIGYQVGGFDALKDALMDVVDLVGMIWKALQSAFAGDILNDISELWSAITSLDPSEILDAFVQRWNHPDPWERWRFRGWLIGFAVMLIAIEVLMAIFTGGAGNAARWGAKAAKLGKLMDFLKGLGAVRKLQSQVHKITNKLPDLEKLRRRLRSKRPDAPKHGDDLTKSGKATPDANEAPDFVGTLRGEKVTLPGVKTRTVRYVKRAKAEARALRSKFDSTERKKFLKSLAEDPAKVQQLKRAGLTDADIASMAKGEVPRLYRVHHKLPLDDGGTNDFSNLVLMQHEPYHKAVTSTQIALTRGMSPGEVRVFEFPIPEGFVYPP
ncbi:eCIS core domain-containing protein [Haliangium sp.]|uniref:eCIS core domain-containing protein n=1 Tax=Haliangium sp. TaxID=2663208 RepID=UPI003D0B9A62